METTDSIARFEAARHVIAIRESHITRLVHFESENDRIISRTGQSLAEHHRVRPGWTDFALECGSLVN